jgi:hypothetical protein
MFSWLSENMGLRPMILIVTNINCALDINPGYTNKFVHPGKSIAYSVYARKYRLRLFYYFNPMAGIISADTTVIHGFARSCR